MKTADWALVISLCSAAISLAGFVWNVWSKFIYPKPKVLVSFNFMTIIQQGAVDREALSLSATNMGPGPTTLQSALVRRKHDNWFKKPGYGLLNPLHGLDGGVQTRGPFSGGLPRKIEVGEQFSAYFIPNHEFLAGDGYDRIGFNDTFGRLHWAPKKDIARTKPHIIAALRASPPDLE